ncbi:glycoside hydrolase family 28 protein [Bacteroides reticulotermitis]|uniref:glycoside hydrolase family 28 protein n=1 Tax=Bacteroides reticulotermitis TaxID=1133319 RepID=UPI00130DC994|nr:glycosyl hydrolase family 28 protein [Bacteroides reticulotermitis]
MCLTACELRNPALSVLSGEEVGDSCLSETILPVEVPFPMPEFRKPVFPDTIVCLSIASIQDSLQTIYINSQIIALSEAGGGTISLEEGKWQTGRIELKSNINLHFPEKIEIYFSNRPEDYLPVVFTRYEDEECLSSGAFIYANNQKNVALTGCGKLIGPELSGKLFNTFREQFNNKAIRKKDAGVPVEERIYDGSSLDATMLLLNIFLPINCEGVFVEGIRIEGSLAWNTAPIYCANVIIRGVNIYLVGVPAGGGINIESTKNVLIEFSTLASGDDCFTIKVGSGEDGARVNKSSENIVIRYCLALTGDGGVTTAGGIKNVYVHDCVFSGTTRGLRSKTGRERGEGGDSLFYERIRIRNATKALNWDMLGSTYVMGELAERSPIRRKTPLTPSYSNIHIKDIVVENAGKFICASGIPESPLVNVTVENAIVSCNKLPEFTDVDSFSIRNSSIISQDSIMTFIDARNITFENVKMTLLHKLCLNKRGPLTTNIIIKK